MEYVFNKNNVVKIEIDNNKGNVYRNDKCLYAFKGDSKIIDTLDKNGNLISVTIKVKTFWNKTYYIALTENENFIRNSLIRILPFLIKYEFDENDYIESLE